MKYLYIWDKIYFLYAFSRVYFWFCVIYGKNWGYSYHMNILICSILKWRLGLEGSNAKWHWITCFRSSLQNRHSTIRFFIVLDCCTGLALLKCGDWPVNDRFMELGSVSTGCLFLRLIDTADSLWSERN